MTIPFLLCLVFPFFNDTFSIIKDIESFENRALKKEPQFDLAKLDPFPVRYEAFYNDHFSLRNTLVKQFNTMNILLFRKSPLPEQLVIGRDGWLFATGEEMDSYTGKNQLTKEELLKFKIELEYRTKYLKSKGCEFYFMVIPCKASVYGEKIGYEYYKSTMFSWGEQLNNYLRSESNVKLIDQFKGLRAKKNGQPIYYLTDSHWNELGAFYACNIALEKINKDFPMVKPLPFHDFVIKREKGYRGNIAKILGYIDFYVEEKIRLVPKNEFRAQTVPKVPYPYIPGFAYHFALEANKEIPGSDAPRLLIISDSFGEDIFPYLSENFSRSVKIFDAWQYQLRPEIVDNEKPQIVLLMIDEPILRNLLKHCASPDLRK